MPNTAARPAIVQPSGAPVPLGTRFSTAGLAHAAADAMTAETGRPWRMAFRPRRFPDSTPFTIEESTPCNA